MLLVRCPLLAAMAVPMATCHWDSTSDSDYLDRYEEPIRHAAYYDDYDVDPRGYMTPEDEYEEDHLRAARLRSSQEAIAELFAPTHTSHTSTWELEDLVTTTRTTRVPKVTQIITSISITQSKPKFQFSTIPDASSLWLTQTLYETTTVVETKSVTATTTLTSSGTPEETESPGSTTTTYKLSGNQIAGIVIGALLGLCVIIFITFLTIKYHRQRSDRVANNPRGAYTERSPNPNGRQSPSYFDTASQDERRFLVNEWPGIVRKLLTNALTKTRRERSEPEPEPEQRIYNPGPPPTPPVPQRPDFDQPVRNYAPSSVYSQESATVRPLDVPSRYGNYV